MSFTDGRFLIFLAIFFAAYFAAPGRVRWIVMLAFSAAFYAMLGGAFGIGVLALTIAIVYVSARMIERRRGSPQSAKDEPARRMRGRAPLIACVTVNFGLLIAFKYAAPSLPFKLVLIPGISFFTFQAVGYLVDVYKGKVAAERNALRLALFLSFFPQLLQGPISRHSQIADDLTAGHGWNWDRAAGGAMRILRGYFMKLAIADYAAIAVDAVFSDVSRFGGAMLVLTLVLYSVQIYADFAGGVSITLGIAQIVGVSLPENFNQPFFANSLTDFWRRWHITLSTWLKDYLFYPVAISKPLGKLGKLARRTLGARLGKLVPASVATFIVYFAMSVWHGVSVNALIFGALNGGLITLSLFLELPVERLRTLTRFNAARWSVARVLAILRTFALMLFLRIFARAETTHTAFELLRRMFSSRLLVQLWDGTLLTLNLAPEELVVMLAAIVVLIVREILAERYAVSSSPLSQRFFTSHPATQYAVTLVLMLFVLYCALSREGYTPSAFIYAQY
ncbi:MAG: hypothetical protein LBC65_00955 [Oscillospiraceae bacterium]|jgi:D-alanyl-lipoteichoic acid acyltransferase DltB (MBOAT superfamily)|nr:hypothetical protein [Oscillospiraceae bacterium]